MVSTATANETENLLTTLTEAETTAERFPRLVGGGPLTQFKLQVAQFGELFTTIHMFRRTAGKVFLSLKTTSLMPAL